MMWNVMLLKPPACLSLRFAILNPVSNCWLQTKTVWFVPYLTTIFSHPKQCTLFRPCNIIIMLSSSSKDDAQTVAFT